MPSSDRLKDIIDGFEDITGLPNVAGAIDESRIKLMEKTRKYDRAAYWSRDQIFSDVQQVVCDHECMMYPFLGLVVSRLHKLHFHHVLQASIVQGPAVNNGAPVQIKSYLIGDKTYHIKHFLLKLFPLGCTEQKKELNKELNSDFLAGRVLIENTFSFLETNGVLKRT